MRKLFSILFILVGFGSSAQIIDNALGDAFVGASYFNAGFIASNKIASIEEVYQIKRDGQPIVSDKGKIIYRFNTVGQLVERTELRSFFSQMDTTVSHYTHADGVLVSECTQRKSGNTCSDHRFEDGLKVQTCYSKKSIDEKGDEFVVDVNCEQFEWSGESDLIKQYKVLNNHGLPYSTVVETYDEYGYLLSKSERHLRGGWSRKTGFEYNERGWIHVLTTQVKSDAPVVEHFTYDELGNLEMVDTSEGDSWKKTDTVYAKNGLLEALLRTSSENSDIHIVKYRYEFRSE